MGRAHLARSRIDSYKKRIQTCENYKKQFVNHLQDLKNKCLNREISYEDYQNSTQKKQGDKTCEEWISYYDSYILECKEIIETERKIITKSNIVSSLASLFFISIFILLFATQGGKLIGFVIQDSFQEYTEELNLNFENSSSYDWHPNIKGQLTTLQVSGKIIGEGSAKIYLDNILILDSNSIKTENSKSLLTGFSVQTGYNPEELTDNTQTKEKEADSSEEEVSPSPSETASAPNEIKEVNETEQNDTIELNQTQEKREKDKLERNFIKHCEDSCNLEDLLLDYSSYPLRIELDNSKIEISSITYKIIPAEKESKINETIELNNTLELNQTEENITLILNETTILNNFSDIKLIKEIPDFKVSINSSLEINLEKYFNNAKNYSLITNNLEHSLNNHNLSITIPSLFTQEKLKIIAYSENESVESNEFIIFVHENTINITKTRGKIRVGQPVKWTNNISLNSLENLTITLPEEANNIEIKEVDLENKEISLSPITGNIIGNSNSNTNFIKRFLQKLRNAFTGYAISESINEEKPENNIILEDNSKEYIIEYETEAPTSEEKSYLNNKEITISAPDELHYTDVIAFTNILDSQKITSNSQISLLWYNYEYDKNISIKSTEEIKENTIIQKEELEVSNIPYLNLELNFSETQENKKDYKLENMPFESYDLNGDGNLDYLEWVVPHLSNQTFNLIFTSQNSTTPGNNISFEGTDGGQYSHLSTDKTSSAHQISDNIVLYFPFDKDSATTSHDFANSYDGTLQGDAKTNATNCISNNCLQLDGTGDYITGSALPIDWTNINWSASVWARLDAGATTGIGIFTNRPGNEANWITLGYTSQSFIGVEINGGTQIDTTINPAGTGWQYYTLVKNDSGLGLYINTTYYHLTNTPEDIGAANTLIHVGDWYNGIQPWKGALDEFMFFNTSLNDTQVSQIYQNTSARYVSSGIQETKFFTVNPNVNHLNITLQNYQRKFGTNISARIGTWDISKDYNTSDFSSSNNLVLYYNLDNRSALGENQTLAVDRKGKANSTAQNGALPKSAGQFAGSYAFDGTNDKLATSANIFSTAFFSNGITISAWTNMTEESSVDDQIISIEGGYWIGTQASTSSAFSFEIDGVGNPDAVATTKSNGKWHHIVGTANSSGFTSIYVDGVLEDTGQENYFNLDSVSRTTTIGGHPTSDTLCILGNVDEAMIFNRSITAEEVKELYVKGRALWTYSNYENITKIDNNDNSSRNNFNISVSTTHILPSFLLVSDTNRFYTPILLANTTNPSNLTLDDTQAPIITINFPANTTYNYSNLNLNVSLNENGSVRYSLNNGLNNFTMTSSVIYINAIGTGSVAGGTFGHSGGGAGGDIALYDGTSVSAADTAELQTTTYTTYNFGATNREIRRIKFYNDPVNGVTDAPTWSLRYSTDNSTWSQVGNNFTTSAGLDNSAQTFDFPASSTYRYWGLFYEAGTTGGNVWVQEIEMYEATYKLGTLFNATNSSIADGSYNFKVYANDTAGNQNNTANVTFTIDTTSPIVTINFPANTTYTSANLPLMFNVSLNEQGSARYSLDNGLNNYTLLNLTGGTLGTMLNRSNESISAGSYTFKVYANDTAGNQNNTANVTFVYSVAAGNTAPVIQNITTSATQSITENGAKVVMVNLTVFDQDGFTNLNGDTARVSFNKTNEAIRNASCSNTANWSTNYANYSCSVQIWYFDASGDWTVNGSILDNAGAAVNNQTGMFTLGQTSAFVLSPGNLTFPAFTAGTFNQTASNDPLLLNNTGNKNITIGNLQINSTNLRGETNNLLGIWANNFSVSNNTGSSAECNVNGSMDANATAMNRSQFVPLNQSFLLVGNHSVNNNFTAQEQLYFCVRTIGSELIGQSYSTLNESAWTIKILSVAFAFAPLSRKKKKITKDKLVKALIIIKEETKQEYSSSKSEVMNIISTEIQEKYNITKQELLLIINEQNNEAIPVSIFTKSLGGLESVCKYLKENRGLSYVEIAKLLNRDQRTIWTAYKKASEKLNIVLEIKQDVPLLPIALLGNRDYTIIESSIIYLKEKGLKYVEIAKLLNRDQRNICSTYKKAKENIKEKEDILLQ